MSTRQTPLVPCPAVEAELGASIYLKLECLQETGSFKLRGAQRALAALTPVQLQRGVVTASAGNHGAGLALSGRELGVAVTVVVPERTPQNKLERMRGLGATVRVEGADYDTSEAIARQLAERGGARFVSAFDDDEVIAGNGGDLARELIEQCESAGLRLAKVLAPIGGGGLIAGLANELVPRGIEVVGAQPANNCAMHDSLVCGHALCEYQGESTIAEGCEGAVCERTYDIVRRHGLPIALVSEESIASSVAFLYRRAGVVAEASAAVPIAALLEERIEPAKDGITVVVVSGGNIDDADLDRFLTES